MGVYRLDIMFLIQIRMHFRVFNLRFSALSIALLSSCMDDSYVYCIVELYYQLSMFQSHGGWHWLTAARCKQNWGIRSFTADPGPSCPVLSWQTVCIIYRIVLKGYSHLKHLWHIHKICHICLMGVGPTSWPLNYQKSVAPLTLIHQFMLCIA